jgi:phosphate transport system substrate-binding protein
MNDEFLHRVRKAPTPQFLQELKSRLDRQPPLGRMPSPRRRWTFTRGLLAGLLLGGAAFALLARLLPGPQQVLPRVQRRDVVPLGPVWLPTHARSGPERPAVPTESAGLTQQSGGADPAAAPASGAAARIASPIGLPAFEKVTVVTSSTAYPLAWSVANRLSGGRVKIEVNSSKPFDRLCTNDPADTDIVEISRRITREEFQGCARLGPFGIVEVKIGYQAVALARAQLYGPLRLSARDLFLALARRVPDPNKPGNLVDNPYTSWNQIAPALPYDRIQILGPTPVTPAGKLMGRLLLEAGCRTFAWIDALRDTDPEQYEQICASLREDSAYRATGSTGWAYANELATNPTALGIFSPHEYAMTHEELVLNPIDGSAPTLENLSAGTYPLARSLYLYTSGARSLGNQVFMMFVMSNLYGNDWGFVQLGKTEINANLAIAQERRAMHF